ncbi:MAG: heavy metal translocating P-type ATPase [Spirochaetaceae bacterium]|jgi:Cd2+/Zn2+-exporting ATPase|nr:heavy metal translocating P-type ATPase [Spirochaetaceae bacterium]
MKNDICCNKCGHNEQEQKELDTGSQIRFRGYNIPIKRALVFIAALVLWGAGFFFLQTFRFAALFCFAGSWLLAGFPVLKKAFFNIRKGDPFDENFLMSIATIGAFAIGEWEEAAGVMLFYLVGELIQDAAIDRSQNDINALLALKPDTARIKTSDGWEECPADTVEPGTTVLVRPGERIPLDGIITEGTGLVDEAMLSGESKPVYAAAGTPVYSGSTSLDSVLTMVSTKRADESSAARIIELVKNAREAKARPDRFITAFARVYTPIVVAVTVLIAVLPPLLIPDAQFSDWFYRALILLVVSCPCALVVSIPLAYFAGIGGLSRRGIMVKGAVHLDTLCKTRYVAFDKTGTLTEGKFSVTAVEPAAGIDEAQLFEIACTVEQESNHPIALALCKYGKERGIVLRSAANVFQFKEIAGQGVALQDGETVLLAGNRHLLEAQSVPLPETKPVADTVIYVAQNGIFCGRILIGDTLKTGAQEAVLRLSALNVTDTLMFTGDSADSAAAVASKLGINTVKAGLLPADKVSETEKLTKLGTTIFVGDGINDAPVLARADLGIAMGSGAEVAIDAADVIIQTSDPRLVSEAIAGSKRIRRIVTANVVFALSAKLLCITLAILGFMNMWLALVADVGVTLLLVFNSSRLLSPSKQTQTRPVSKAAGYSKVPAL